MMMNRTSAIVALRQEQLWAADADIRASERNTALVATLEQSLTALREQKQSTARRDVERWQQQLHGKQLEELHRLRGALVDVQARRQRAQLEFEAEMHSRCGVVASIDAVEAWARRALQNTRARAVWQPEPRRSTGEPHGPERSAEGIQHRRSALWSGVGRMFHTASARGSRVDRSADASNGHAALPASLPSTPGIARAGTHNAARGICDVPPQLDERPCLEWTVERFSANPLISHQLTNMSNINGPSVIRAPGWLRTITARGYTIGRYLMYFSGRFSTGIRLASAEQLSGPWRFHPVPVLDVSDVRAAGCHSHVASPDVHVEEGARRLRMLFHCPSRSSTRHDQLTFAATSRDGLRFRSHISTHPRNIASRPAEHGTQLTPLAFCSSANKVSAVS